LTVLITLARDSEFAHKNCGAPCYLEMLLHIKNKCYRKRCKQNCLGSRQTRNITQKCSRKTLLQEVIPVEKTRRSCSCGKNGSRKVKSLKS